MSYLKFDKEQLVNLEYALSREFLRTNRAGSFSSTTIIGCNTRKYHGLIITAQPGVDKGLHVLLSSLDETIIQHDAEFNLGIHMFRNEVFSPKGHKYIADLDADPIPHITYRVGEVKLKKERFFSTSHNRFLTRYTLLEAEEPITLRLRAFLAFRNRHHVMKANQYVDARYFPIENGIRVRLYEGYDYLNMQCSKKMEYIHCPDWFYDFEYAKDRERGFEYREDLFVPGYFDIPLKKGETIVFSASLEEVKPNSLKRLFNSEIKKRTPRDSYRNCLLNSAEQFLAKEHGMMWVLAGYPWLGSWARDTFIALPGLTLARDNPKMFVEVVDAMVSEMEGPFFKNEGTGSESTMPTLDASLWFFYALRWYVEVTGDGAMIWERYHLVMRNILSQFRRGVISGAHMLDSGLLRIEEGNKPLTWMDAVVDGKPNTPRYGQVVELNALWYDAISLSLMLAREASDKLFVEEWEAIAQKIPSAFLETFWNEDYGFLADYVDGDYYDWSVRPNQIVAAASPFGLLPEEIRMSVVNRVQKELLTPRGLRTLSPKDQRYQSTYKGVQHARDLAFHQGTAWPWLLGFFAEAYFSLYGSGGIHTLKEIYRNFEDEMQEHGMGSISQLYSGDPPYEAGGTISHATSVGALLLIDFLVKKNK
ncbi:MAG: amylo-alpha-1,6-glucosidase [Bacteroidetes bacterium]|nr:MAG: amylo-alpha-1,6-glucosidase [Bacteroidota bacterium]PIE87753.1 MAG: amylo-alpha-1,6-glucosidase [Bacteroidota bacterium]